MVVDFGCGSGNVLVAAVLRYGAKAYGIEKDEAAFDAAVANVAAMLTSTERKRVHLYKGNFAARKFGPEWLAAIGATHAVVFNKAFNLVGGSRSVFIVTHLLVFFVSGHS